MVYLAIFIGGALGSLARFLLVDSHVFAFSPKGFESLIAISFVNLLGALVLGFVNNTSLIANNKWRLFWGTGFAGGFTTMSGVGVITAGFEQGLGSNGVLIWLLVAIQFVLGIVFYRLGSAISKKLSTGNLAK